MKKILSLLIISSFTVCSLAQQRVSERGFEAGLRYDHSFVLGGFVNVREWDLVGDKIYLRDLGMDHYPAVQVHFTRKFSRWHRFSLLYAQEFFRGKAVINRDLNYNGTIINGRDGLDVSSTTYHRITAVYDGLLTDGLAFDLGYTVGLVYDRINFYVDGKIPSYSPRQEVYENFGKQAFPYPFVGVYGDFSLTPSKQIKWRTGGTYIPEFKSFYKEGGNMSLQYRAIYGDFAYQQSVRQWRFSLGGNVRYMYLFQESKEDTNIIELITAGPYARIDFVF